MFQPPRFLLLFLLLPALAQQPTIPDTPAGHTLRAWVSAFNSGDRLRMEIWIKTFHPVESIDGMVSFRNQTGGFDLLSVESSDPLHISARLEGEGQQCRECGQV
jgi:hypothetical protein